MADDRARQVELYVSCAPQRPPRNFCVEPGTACVLAACGLAPDQVVPVQKVYGPDLLCEPARDLGGAVLALTRDRPTIVVSLPGNYKLDVAALSVDPCVRITEQCITAADAAALVAAAAAQTAPKTYLPTGLVQVGSDGVCYPVFLCPGASPAYITFNADGVPEMARTPIAAPKLDEPSKLKYASYLVAVDSTSGITDVASLVALVAADEAGPKQYLDADGNVVAPLDPVADTVMAVQLQPRPEDGADTVIVSGIPQGGFVYNMETDGPYANTAPIPLAIEDPCNFVASVCWCIAVGKDGSPI